MSHDGNPATTFKGGIVRRSVIKTMLLATIAIVASLLSTPGLASAQQAAIPGQPASVLAGPFWVVSAVDGSCLANYGREIYLEPCANVSSQRWELWFGGWAKNVGTGYCLTLRPGWSVGADDCRWGDKYQEWKQWNGGWFQNHYDNACLEWFPGYVWGEPCLVNYVDQHWYLRT